jgi:hypothetical protein
MSEKMKMTRSGKMATVYGVKRKVVDPNVIKNPSDSGAFAFQGGASYKGDWKDNYKSGFGVEEDTDGTKYEGEWKGGVYHGKGTQWVIRNKRSVKQYAGEYAKGKMHGFGVYHYANGDKYSGTFAKGERSGKGKLEYADGDYYVGEWASNRKNGEGCMYYVNGNVYHGRWMEGEKEGPGRFFYASTKKVYEGEWADGAPVCGSYRAPTPDEETLFKASKIRVQGYELPVIGLANSRAVLDMATTAVRLDRSRLRGTTFAANPMGMTAIQNAEDAFGAIDTEQQGWVPFSAIGGVLLCLGLGLEAEDLEDIRLQLDVEANQRMSFPDIVDICNFLSDQLA